MNRALVTGWVTESLLAKIQILRHTIDHYGKKDPTQKGQLFAAVTLGGLMTVIDLIR